MIYAVYIWIDQFVFVLKSQTSLCAGQNVQSNEQFLLGIGGLFTLLYRRCHIFVDNHLVIKSVLTRFITFSSFNDLHLCKTDV